MWSGLLRSLRPAQWVKNLFVVAPLVFAERALEAGALGRTLLTCALFCAAASAIYLLNDWRDREEDRRHFLKRHRPIAAGAVPAGLALGTALLLATLALAGAWALGPAVLGWTGLYVVLQTAYTCGLKRVVILDVMLIALGFTLRVLAGGAAAAVAVSSWLLLCTLFLALFLALSKRRHEVAAAGGDGVAQRAVLGDYGLTFLDQMINVVTASTIVSYAIYATLTPGPAEGGGPGTNFGLPWTVPLVAFGIFRYLYLVYQRPGARSPTETLLRDVPFLVNLALWAGAVLWIYYGN